MNGKYPKNNRSYGEEENSAKSSMNKRVTKSLRDEDKEGESGNVLMDSFKEMLF